MFGHRGRLGLIIPANNTVIEPEFAEQLPAGVVAHATRLLGSRGSIDPAAIDRMQAQALRGAGELEVAGVSAIAYACMGTTLVQPPAWADHLTESIEHETGIRAVTASQATVQGLRAVGARRIAVLSPYPATLSVHVPAFFSRQDLTVLAEDHLGIDDVRSVGDFPAERIIDAAISIAATPDIDAVCLLATDWPTLRVLPDIQANVVVPVISTNRALLWWLLRHIGFDIDIRTTDPRPAGH